MQEAETLYVVKSSTVLEIEQVRSNHTSMLYILKWSNFCVCIAAGSPQLTVVSHGSAHVIIYLSSLINCLSSLICSNQWDFFLFKSMQQFIDFIVTAAPCCVFYWICCDSHMTVLMTVVFWIIVIMYITAPFGHNELSHLICFRFTPRSQVCAVSVVYVGQTLNELRYRASR